MKAGKVETKHAQVVLDLQERLSNGTYRLGQQLPSEPLLAQEYGVAYMTIRRAISTLVGQGKLYRVRGRGTFVADPPPRERLPSIGLLLLPNWQSIDPFYFPPLVGGFVSFAKENGYQVHLADRSEPLLELLQTNELHSRAIACVILKHDDHSDADELLDRGVMVVAINNYAGLRRVTSVSPDNRQGCYDATRSLLDLGHRDLVLLSGPMLNMDSSERKKGFDAAIREAGASVRRVRVIETELSEEAGYELAKRLVMLGILPTAIVSMNDLPAIGMMKGLQEAGVRVPQDVSVLGFGDYRLAAYVSPALTTVKIDLEMIGRKAAEAVIAQYRGGRGDHVVIGCPIVWRESVAGPRSNP